MKNLVLEKLATLGQDVEVTVKKDMIDVMVLDFDGFDSDYCEIEREYDEDKVDEVLEWLEEQCQECVLDYYQEYSFDGFFVQVGYASYDI